MRPQIVRLDTARFTAGNVEKLSLPVGKTDHIEWDPELPGFGVRLRAGSAFYVVQYRIGSKQRRESLGDIRKTDLEQARKNARIRFAQIELGIDPRAERDKLEASQKAEELTFKVLFEDYLEAREGAQRASTHSRLSGISRALGAPAPAGRPHHRSRDRRGHAPGYQPGPRPHLGGPGKGEPVRIVRLVHARGFDGRKSGVGTNDPAEGIEPRDRVLTPDELKAIWKQCRDDDFGRIIRLLLLTACRRDEIGGLRWSEVDPDTGKMLLPEDRTKNGRPLALTLPDAARSILQAAPRRAGRDLAFGGGKTGFNAWSYSTLALNSRITEANGRALRPGASMTFAGPCGPAWGRLGSSRTLRSWCSTIPATKPGSAASTTTMITNPKSRRRWRNGRRTSSRSSTNEADKIGRQASSKSYTPSKSLPYPGTAVYR